MNEIILGNKSWRHNGILQYCPFSEDRYCYDWCPAFDIIKEQRYIPEKEVEEKTFIMLRCFPSVPKYEVHLEEVK